MKMSVFVLIINFVLIEVQSVKRDVDVRTFKGIHDI